MRVLIATDGSIEADVAEAVCVRLPLPATTQVTVAMVTHLQTPIGAGFMPESVGMVEGWVSENLRIQRIVSEQTVARVVERLQQAGLQAEGLVLAGDPAEQVEAAAEKTGAQLIVVGSGLDSNLAAFLLGSMSRRLVLHSPVSVLVGKHYQEMPPEGTHDRLTHTEKLSALIAVDGSPGSDLAVQSLESVERPVFSTLYTLCVDTVPWWPGGLELVQEDGGAEQVAREAAERIRRCADTVTPLSAAGRPSIVIANEAKARNLDLVMLGASRHSTFERVLAGSCAYETATSAPCSVMVLREPLPFA